MKDHSISEDQDRYDNSIVAKYMDTATVKTSTKFYKTTMPSDVVFTKDDVSTSDEQIGKLIIELIIHCRDFIVPLIYLLSTRVYFSFAVKKLANLSSNPGQVHF